MRTIVGKRSVKLVTTGSAVFLIFAAIASGSSAIERSMSGRGILNTGTAFDGSTIEREFSFNAHTRKDGTVEGIAMLYSTAEDSAKDARPYVLQIDISCMNVIGNVVFFGGTTHRTTNPKLADAVYFSVLDNGESGTARDQMSRVYFFDDDPNTTGDPQLCMGNKIGDFPMETLISGDINIGE